MSRQLVDMRVAESNRLEVAGSRAVRSIRSVIKTLDKQLQGIRLIAACKPKKVAIVAGMGKLLTILNAINRDQAAWNPAAYLQTQRST